VRLFPIYDRACDLAEFDAISFQGLSNWSWRVALRQTFRLVAVYPAGTVAYKLDHEYKRRNGTTTFLDLTVSSDTRK